MTRVKMNSKDRLNQYPTTPAINLLSASLRGRFVKLYLRRASCTTKKSVDHCKSRLGRQDYCWNGEYRNWIWEFDDNGYLMRVFVNNVQGFSIEFSKNTPPKEVYTRTKKFLERLK